MVENQIDFPLSLNFFSFSFELVEFVGVYSVLMVIKEVLNEY